MGKDLTEGSSARSELKWDSRDLGEEEIPLSDGAVSLRAALFVLVEDNSKQNKLEALNQILVLQVEPCKSNSKLKVSA